MKKNSKIHVVVIIGVVFLFISVFLFMSSAREVMAAEKVFNWKFSQWSTGPTGNGLLSVWWAKQVEKRSNGQIKVKIYWTNELNGPKEIMMAVQSRLADVVSWAPSFNPSEAPIWNLTWLPFLGPARRDHAVVVYDRLAKEVKPFMDEFDRYNCVYAGSFDTVHYNIIGKKPVRTVADLKGLRVRCLSGLSEILAEVGAVPVTVATTEMYSALDTGIVDVVAQNQMAFHAYKLDELSKYMTLDMDMGCGAAPFLINKNAWNELPDNLKNVVNSVRDDLAAVGEDFLYLPERVAEANEVIKRRGIEVIHFPKAERDKLLAKADPVWELWARRTGNYALAKQALADFIRIRDEVVVKYPQKVPGPKYEP
jgi:TRAP-type transport system periplasmic protein